MVVFVLLLGAFYFFLFSDYDFQNQTWLCETPMWKISHS